MDIYHHVPKFYVHCMTIYGRSWPFIGSNTRAHAILHTRRAVVADPGPSRRPHRLEPAAFLGRGLRGGTWGSHRCGKSAICRSFWRVTPWIPKVVKCLYAYVMFPGFPHGYFTIFHIHMNSYPRVFTFTLGYFSAGWKGANWSAGHPYSQSEMGSQGATKSFAAIWELLLLVTGGLEIVWNLSFIFHTISDENPDQC